MLKSLVTFTLALVVLIFSATAFSGQFEIEIGRGWVKGKADNVPLGKLLTEVTQKAGYPIYVDEQILQNPVSFDIQTKLVHENFIKRIVNPHSYAVVFGSEGEDSASKILEIWVFRKGEQFTAKYLALKATPVEVNAPVSSSPNSASGTSSYTSNIVPRGGASVDPRAVVKRRLHVKENAYGGSSFSFRDAKEGPDYRPSSYQRQQAYWKYRSSRKAYEQRIAAGMFFRDHRHYKGVGNEYWARRNSQIRQQIMDLKNSKDEEEKE